MRQSGRRLAEVVAELRESVAPGVCAKELDELAERRIRALGGVPSFLGYQVGRAVFPATICASPNEQVVHGIPDEREYQEGDLVSIDVGMIYMGYHSDCAFTVAVGEVSAAVQQLLDVTEQSLYQGVAAAVPGSRIGDIGHTIQSSVEPHGFGVVREYVGHGIGRKLHEKPSVPNYGKPRRGPHVKAGMCIAIEPMCTMGSPRTLLLDDEWTVVTADGGLAAHFEHTVAVTPRGPEILTTLNGQSPL